MTVKELMAKLEKCDPEGEVWVQTEAELLSAELAHHEGANCVIDRVDLIDDDNPDAVAHLRSRQRAGRVNQALQWATFPVLITKPNE